MAAAGNIPMQAPQQPFPHIQTMACCGVHPIGAFPFDTPGHDAYTQQQLENLETNLRYNDVGSPNGCFTYGGAQICIINSATQKRVQEMLVAHGFIPVAKFKSGHGNGVDLIVLMRGATVEKIIKKKRTLKDKPGL